jgi:hypothetical protein
MILEMKLKLIRDVETGIIAHARLLHECASYRPRQGNCSRVASGWVGVSAFLQSALQVERALFPVKSKWFGLAPFPSYGCAAWRVRTFTAAMELHRLRCLGAVLGVAPLQILGLGIDSFPTSSDGLGDGANGALGAPSLNSTAPMPLSALIG